MKIWHEWSVACKAINEDDFDIMQPREIVAFKFEIQRIDQSWSQLTYFIVMVTYPAPWQWDLTCTIDFKHAGNYWHVGTIFMLENI